MVRVFAGKLVMISMQQQITQEQNNSVVNLSPSVVRFQADQARENAFYDIFVKSANFEKDTKCKFKNHPILDASLLFTLIIPTLSYVLFFKYKPGFVFYMSFKIVFLCFKLLGHYIPFYKFEKQTRKLLPFYDIRSAGLITRLASVTHNTKKQGEIFAVLQPLLEAVTKADIGYFPAGCMASLRHLSSHKRIRREFPELMQAIIVALYTLQTKENKTTLEKLAKEKTKRADEKWIAKAAQSCLEAWGSEENP
jgi:hypothetical protein